MLKLLKGKLIMRGHVRMKSYSSNDYCLNVVRSLDKENFLCTLLLPSTIRETAFAIRAFNAEVASVQDQVSQTHLGQMRLKFWEECIDKVYSGKVPNNPVAVELAKAAKVHKLSKALLKKLVISRMRRLDQPTFMSVGEMETYAGATCSSIFLLILEAAQLRTSKTEAVADSVGKAQGLANLLRGVPHNITKGILTLPSDLLARHDVVEESILRGGQPPELADVVKDVASNVFLHLSRARGLRDDLPLPPRSIFLPAIATQTYMDSLRNASFDVFDPGLVNKSPLLPLKLYWNNLLKRY